MILYVLKNIFFEENKTTKKTLKRNTFMYQFKNKMVPIRCEESNNFYITGTTSNKRHQ